MTRVAVQIQGVVEQYDDAGRLVSSQAVSPVQVAGLSPMALEEALDAVRDQLTGAWVGPAPVVENAE